MTLIRKALTAVLGVLSVTLILPACQASKRTLTAHTVPGGRTYTLFDWPHSATKPLVVMLPGLGQSTADARAAMPDVERAAEGHGFVLAWAESLPSSTSDHAWNAGPCCAGQTADDLGYLVDVLADVASRTPVDLTRIYVWGMSNGGMLAIRAVCQPGTLFAAAGSVAGPWLGTSCDRPVWRHLHGAVDPVVPLYGGVPPGIPALGVPADWCSCSFPDSTAEPSRAGGFVSVSVDPAASHTWPQTAAEDLWANTSPFSLEAS